MTKHTKIYKQRRNLLVSSVLIILMIGLLIPFLIRNIVLNEVDFWTYYDGVLLVWSIATCSRLYAQAEKDFLEISHQERKPSWKEARRRYEYLLEKESLTEEEAKELLGSPLDVIGW